MPAFYYAVAKGRNPGIYATWPECQVQVHQYPFPIYRKFSSKSEAEEFIKNRGSIRLTKTVSEKESTSCESERSNNEETALPSGKKLSVLSKTPKALGSSKRCTSLDSVKEAKSPKRIKLIDANESACNNLRVTEGLSDYTTDESGYVNVYTDGACSSNGNINAKAGIGVWFGNQHPLNVSRAVSGRATNNMAEIQAVTVAALQAKKAGIKKLKINTDSKFLISCITEWMPRWKANGWKTAANKPVINKTELIEMENALSSLVIAWKHVNGHAGIYGNEMADKLARQGCSKY